MNIKTMNVSIEVGTNASLDELRECIAALQGMAALKRRRSSKGQSRALTTDPKPSAQTAPAPAQDSNLPNNQTALPAPVPFVPQLGAPPPHVFIPVPFKPEAGEILNPTEGKLDFPREPVRTASGEMVLPAPVPVRAPAVRTGAPFAPVPVAAKEVSGPARWAATLKQDGRQS